MNKVLTKTTCPLILFRGVLKNNFTIAHRTAGIISKRHSNISNISFIGLAGICLYFLFAISIFMLLIEYTYCGSNKIY